MKFLIDADRRVAEDVHDWACAHSIADFGIVVMDYVSILDTIAIGENVRAGWGGECLDFLEGIIASDGYRSALKEIIMLSEFRDADDVREQFPDVMVRLATQDELDTLFSGVSWPEPVIDFDAVLIPAGRIL